MVGCIAPGIVILFLKMDFVGKEKNERRIKALPVLREMLGDRSMRQRRQRQGRRLRARPVERSWVQDRPHFGGLPGRDRRGWRKQYILHEGRGRETLESPRGADVPNQLRIRWCSVLPSYPCPRADMRS